MHSLYLNLWIEGKNLGVYMEISCITIDSLVKVHKSYRVREWTNNYSEQMNNIPVELTGRQISLVKQTLCTFNVCTSEARGVDFNKL